VLLICCERCTDDWLESGGKDIEDKDPRRFSIQDCFAIPGLQAKVFAPTPETGFAIVHEKSKITIDEDVIIIDNGKLVMKMNKDKFSLTNGAKDLYTIYHTFFTDFLTFTYVGSPAEHHLLPSDVIKVQQLITDLSQLLEAS